MGQNGIEQGQNGIKQGQNGIKPGQNEKHFAPFDVSNITAIFWNKDYVGVVCFGL